MAWLFITHQYKYSYCCPSLSSNITFVSEITISQNPLFFKEFFSTSANILVSSKIVMYKISYAIPENKFHFLFFHKTLLYISITIHQPQSSAYGFTSNRNSASYTFFGTLFLYLSAIINISACLCILYSSNASSGVSQ